MDLLDALAGRQQARSVAELSLEAPFRQGYRSLYRAIEKLAEPPTPALEWVERMGLERRLQAAVLAELPAPEQRPYRCFGVDSLSLARPHAATLHDRGYVHQAQAAPGAKPVTVGHRYSILTALPEKATPDAPPWAVPLSTRRVATDSQPQSLAVEQAKALLERQATAWEGELCVLVADSAYSGVPCLGALAEEENLVVISRLRSNRVLYRQAKPETPRKRGRPPVYGAPFRLGDPQTHGAPDETRRFTLTTRRGRQVEVTLEAWHGLLMRGKKDLPMHRHPLTALRVTLRDEAGEPLFKRPMWLVVCGQRRDEVSLEEAHANYRQRFDQEHMHRFARQNLLLDAFQTPETPHEESWMMLVGLAYAQLWVARDLAEHLPRPWERKQRHSTETTLSPTMVQRSLPRILAQSGTPARPPKRRGNGKGRAPGTSPGLRRRFPVVKKASKAA